MKIAPEIEIHEHYNHGKIQRKETDKTGGNRLRFNNRKTTRSRKVQYVVTVKSLFPYSVIRKEIKTNK